jgi:hypothetical protein
VSRCFSGGGGDCVPSCVGAAYLRPCTLLISESVRKRENVVTVETKGVSRQSLCILPWLVCECVGSCVRNTREIESDG